MNAKKAKKIKKAVYGDESLRQERKYIEINKHVHGLVHERIVHSTLVNDPNTSRAKYQRAKRTANAKVRV